MGRFVAAIIAYSVLGMSFVYLYMLFFRSNDGYDYFTVIAIISLVSLFYCWAYAYQELDARTGTLMGVLVAGTVETLILLALGAYGAVRKSTSLLGCLVNFIFLIVWVPVMYFFDLFVAVTLPSLTFGVLAGGLFFLLCDWHKN